jgi:hypothetical protein
MFFWIKTKSCSRKCLISLSSKNNYILYWDILYNKIFSIMGQWDKNISLFQTFFFLDEKIF